ncbi:uncharacterized protein PHA67_023243 [Liasis olivaceus]
MRRARTEEGEENSEDYFLAWSDAALDGDLSRRENARVLGQLKVFPSRRKRSTLEWVAYVDSTARNSERPSGKRGRRQAGEALLPTTAAAGSSASVGLEAKEVRPTLECKAMEMALCPPVLTEQQGLKAL